MVKILIADDEPATRALLLLTPMLDDDGNVVLLVPEARDITETKQAEDLLRGSEQKLGLIYDKAPFAIALARLPEGIMSECR